MNALLLALLCTVGQTDEYVQDFHHDFRGTRLPEVLGRQGGSGAVMTTESEGLRITLPKGRKGTGQVGVFTTFPVKGDFEITAAYEILHADQPTEGWGVGATLYVYADQPLKDAVGIYRLNRPKGVQSIHWDCAVMRDGERKYRADRVACDANLFRLRMIRKAQTLTCYWAPGLVDDDFRAIGTMDFVSDDLKSVVLNTTTGSKPFDLDVRFLELRIRSSIKSLSEPDPAKTPGERVWQRWRRWLIALLIGVTLVAAWFHWRLRRRRQAGSG
jgi:hypothetical protein